METIIQLEVFMWDIGINPPITENQLEKTMENDMEA